MIPAFILLAIAPSFAPAADATWSAPKVFVEGRPYKVHVELTVPKSGTVRAAMFEAGAFQIDGKPIAESKNKEELKLEAGSVMKLDLDLADAITSSKAYGKHDFKLGYPGADEKPVDVRVFVVAPPKGLEFMDEKKTPVAELAKYDVLIETNRGNMVVEFWPDVAPGHVRNFLDLSYTGFYNGVLFHRVGAGFMIQGGDPNTRSADTTKWGTGGGPRPSLKHEFSAKKHVRGVLSMARGGGATPAQDEKMWDSASCQFFVMDGPNPGLDGKYSAFGMLVDGFDTLDKIVNSPGSRIDAGTVRPNEPQKILSATVLRAPESK